MGEIALQGPHQTAQKSIRTGICDCLISASNVKSLTSTGSAILLSPLFKLENKFNKYLTNKYTNLTKKNKIKHTKKYFFKLLFNLLIIFLLVALINR
jgi:hypothetical protein